MQELLEYHRLNDAATQWGQKTVANIGGINETTELIKALEKLKKDIVGEKMDAFFKIMTDFLEPFNAGKLAYTWEAGFTVDGLKIAHESDGCALMMFESAFRVAIARTTGGTRGALA